ncbi:MAG: cation:proton antiporter, partial [Longimicrobiales bacterium]|nr:cation:proton antiporter [Longimicrobiales bacterium]
VDSTVVTFIVSLVVLLFVATAMSVLTKRVRMPLSIVLVLVGLLLGELIRLYPALGPMARLQLSEEMLLYVFLPTLVFHAAFAMDSRLLMKNIGPVLVLAIPAVFISFIGVGYGLHWTLGAPLGAAILFGALITATDSSAVLTLFREIGAPKRLTILVQGENLFNDAVSIVIFILAAGAVGVGSVTIPEGANVFLYGAREFLVAFLGGLATGAAVGYAFGKMIEAVENDDLIEILLTTVVAFLSFLVAEFAIGASGITAVVGAGVVLGGWGRTKFSPGTLDYLNRFWAYLAFVVNSLVFLLTGLAVVWRPVLATIGLGTIAVAFLISILARAVSIYGLFPLVNILPGIEPTGGRYQTAIVWGGIRGGTALALALTLPSTYGGRELVVGLTIGVVLSSLFFQGMTLEPVIRLLGLHKVTPLEEYSRDEALLRVKSAGRARVPSLRSGGVISGSVARELEKTYRAEQQAVRDRVELMRQHELVGRQEETRLLRAQMLLAEKRSYRDLFRDGVLSEGVFKDLQHSIDVQLDHVHRSGEVPTWTIHSPIRWWLQRALFRVIDAIAPAGGLAQRFRLNRIAERYEENWAKVITSHRALEELRGIREAGAFQEDVVLSASHLYERWLENAQKRLDLIGEQFPEYATKVQEMVALRLCLYAEEDTIVELGEVDALSERDVLELRRDVERRLRALRRKPIEELEPTPRELLAKVPFFHGLPPEEFEVIVGLLRPRTLLSGEAVVREGEVGSSLFLIGRGVVRVTVVDDDGVTRPVATLLAGDFFGEMAMLAGGDAVRSATVTTATEAVLYELRRDDLEAVLAVCPIMRGVLESASAERRRELQQR